MKKIICILMLTIIVTFNCGFSVEDEYEEFLNKYQNENGKIVCTYNTENKTKVANLKSISLEFDKETVNIIYDTTTKSTSTIAEIVYKNGKVKKLKYKNNDYEVGDYNFIYRETSLAGEIPYFSPTNFLEWYKNNTKCPNIYLLQDSNKYTLYDTDEFTDYYRSNVIILNPTKNADNNINTNTNNTCVEENAVACKKYTKSTYLYGDVDIELGIIKNNNETRYYFNITKDDFTNSSINQNTTIDSLEVNYNRYSFVIRANDYQNLFLPNNQFPSEIYLDEKSFMGDYVIHITVPGSQTIKDYEMFGKPSDVEDEPYDNSENNTTPQEDLGITNVDFCSQYDANGNPNYTLLVFQVIGYIIVIIKILVPIILIVLGSIDLGKASISQDEKALKDAVTKFCKRILIGLIIFFIPTILDFFLSLVSGVSDIADKFRPCTECVLNPDDPSKCSPKKLNET